MLAHPVAMGLALVYLAEHWVIDLIAGWACVGASFAIWGMIERRLTLRRHRLDTTRLDPMGTSETAPAGEPITEGAQEWTRQPA